MIPGACFALSGVYNVISPLITAFNGIDTMAELALNPLSLSVYFT